MELEAILKPVSREMSEVETQIRRYVFGDGKVVADLGRYVFDSPGKMLRPALTLLSARVGSKNRTQAIKLAAALEMIHTATLVQDDVIDAADLRRGISAFHKKWGDRLAILFGDYLYSKSFAVLAALGNVKVLDSISATTNQLCLGEMEQLKKAKTFLTEKVYLRIIERKTAALFAACGEAGGIVGGATPAQTKALKQFGLNFGLAFQIIDDCLDYASTSEKTGKSVGLDKRVGKITLPVIYGSLDKAIAKARFFMVRANRSFEAKSFSQLGDYVLSRVS